MKLLPLFWTKACLPFLLEIIKFPVIVQTTDPLNTMFQPIQSSSAYLHAKNKKKFSVKKVTWKEKWFLVYQSDQFISAALVISYCLFFFLMLCPSRMYTIMALHRFLFYIIRELSWFLGKMVEWFLVAFSMFGTQSYLSPRLACTQG